MWVMYSPLTTMARWTSPVRRNASATVIPVNMPAHALVTSKASAFVRPHWSRSRAAVLGSNMNLLAGPSYREMLQEMIRSISSAP